MEVSKYKRRSKRRSKRRDKRIMNASMNASTLNEPDLNSLFVKLPAQPRGSENSTSLATYFYIFSLTNIARYAHLPKFRRHFARFARTYHLQDSDGLGFGPK